MSYHYVREPGEEGNIITNEGEAAGLDLATLLSAGRPPLRVAIELGSALADILTIAEEDKAIHGDIKPANVRVDANGAVSVDGFGQVRRTTRAPEGKPVSHQTDVFGLGVILHSILSPEPLGFLPRDAEGHDGAVVDRVLSMDFSEVEGKRWVEDVRRFLCLILAFEPTERPAPLDAANVLAQVAAQCPGQSLSQWAARAVPAAGGQAPTRKPSGPVVEDLGGPVARSGPLPASPSGAYGKSNRQAPSAKGESTAFFSKAKIAAMMADQDDDSEEAPAPQPRRNLAAPPDNKPKGRGRVASAPDEDLGGPSAMRFNSAEPIERKDAFTEEEFFQSDSAPTTLPKRPAAPVGSPFGQGAAPAGPAGSPFAGAGLNITGPVEGAAVAEPEPEEAPRSNRTRWLVLGGVVLVLGCMGLTGAGGLAWWYFNARGGEEVAEVEPAEVEPASGAPAEVAEAEPPTRPTTDKDDTGEAGAKARVETPPAEAAPAVAAPLPKAEAPKTEAPKATTTPAKTSGDTPRKTTQGSSGKATNTGTRKTEPAPAPTPAPAPVVSDAQYEIRLVLAGSTAKASVSCGDGQSRKFTGNTRMLFTGTVSCRIESEGKRGAFTASSGGSVNCTAGATDILCTSS